MILIALLMATATATATATAGASADPLKPAKCGSVQCYMPDEGRRTCRSIASYVPINSNTYSNKAMVLIAREGPIILATVTPVTLKAGAVCGFIREEDIRAAKLYVGQGVLPASKATPLLEQLARSSIWAKGMEICTTYVPTKDGLIAKVAYDGDYQENSDQRVKWIRPSDGYSVAP